LPDCHKWVQLRSACAPSEDVKQDWMWELRMLLGPGCVVHSAIECAFGDGFGCGLVASFKKVFVRYRGSGLVTVSEEEVKDFLGRVRWRS
jgi:hypothetical protein